MSKHDDNGYGLALSSEASASEYSEDAMSRYFNQFKEALDKFAEKADVLIAQAGKEWQNATNFTLDANGGTGSFPQGGFVVYEHKEGFVADITQVVFWLDGQTPGSILTTAGVWVAAYKNVVSPTSLIAYSPQPGNNAVFPNVVQFPRNTPPVLRMNDKVIIQVVGAVALAGKNCTVILNGNISREATYVDMPKYELEV